MGNSRIKMKGGDGRAHRHWRKVAQKTVWAETGPGMVSERKEVGGPLSVRLSETVSRKPGIKEVLRWLKGFYTLSRMGSCWKF